MNTLWILWIWFIAIVSTQIMNFISSKLTITWFNDIIKISLIFAIPVVLINIFYMSYYSFWIKTFPFVVLFLLQFSTALVTSLIIQSTLLKQAISKDTYIWILFIIMWLIIINKDKIITIFK
jgi:hypothetical protein